jgi:molecular chaperone GrpE
MEDQPVDPQERLDTPASADAGIDTASEALDALKRERDSLQDRLLRTLAEFDNYRKRTERERREQAENSAADVLAELLPIVDDLERALQASSGADADAYRQGVTLIHRQMMEMLRRRGVHPIEAVGTDFDPRVHQAVEHQVSAEHRDNEVMDELRRGYTLGTRLLRPAMVKVARRE